MSLKSHSESAEVQSWKGTDKENLQLRSLNKKKTNQKNQIAIPESSRSALGASPGAPGSVMLSLPHSGEGENLAQEIGKICRAQPQNPLIKCSVYCFHSISHLHPFVLESFKG